MVAYIRSWQTAPSVNLGTVKVEEGAPLRGEAVYAVHCEDCHGVEGKGGTFMSVSNPEFLVSADDRFLTHVIREGRVGTNMIGYAGELTPQNITDVVALLRSWESPVDDTPCTLPSKDIAGRFVNPDGPPPEFPADGRFISVAEVFAAYDGGDKMMMLDARPPCDYVDEHIAGAVSVPFYDGAAYIDQLPKDEWIVTYCACPHAESNALADVLVGAGLTKVKVLDEGLPLWLENGHPVE